MLVFDGDTAKTVALYMGDMDQGQGGVNLTDHPRRLPGMAKVLKRLTLHNAKGQVISGIHQDQDMFISIEYQRLDGILPSHVGFVLYSQEGIRVTGFNTAMEHCVTDSRIPRAGSVTFRIPGNSLNPGLFVVSPAISALPNNLLDKVEYAISFEVQKSDIYGTGYILTSEDGFFPLRCTMDARSTEKDATICD